MKLVKVRDVEEDGWSCVDPSEVCLIERNGENDYAVWLRSVEKQLCVNQKDAIKLGWVPGKVE